MRQLGVHFSELLPDGAGSWEGTNSDICVAMTGLTDRLLPLILGLPPCLVQGDEEGKEEEEKGRKKWRKRKKTGREKKNGEFPTILRR